MATEYKLSYTANKIDEKLGEIDTLNANAVKVTPQTFTEEQKAQARENIGAQATLETYTEENAVGSQQNKTDANNDVWTQWNSRLSFGMDTENAAVPFVVGGQLLADGTIIAHNNGTMNKNRWGFHVFEAYAKDNYSRMTMLLDKHNAETNGKPSLELYYYTGANHYAPSYGNTKIGSDVALHSFCFDRDKMTAYGEIDNKMPITLARISLSNDIDSAYETVDEADAAYEPENNAVANNKCLKYIALKNAENGAMFYDTDRDKAVIKINGLWCDIPFTTIRDSSYGVLGQDFDRIPCESIVLSASELHFTDNSPQVLTAIVSPSNTSDTIVWSSSNKNVAVADGSYVYAVGCGSAIITATCGNCTATCDITVDLPYVATWRQGSVDANGYNTLATRIMTNSIIDEEIAEIEANDGYLVGLACFNGDNFVGYFNNEYICWVDAPDDTKYMKKWNLKAARTLGFTVKAILVKDDFSGLTPDDGVNAVLNNTAEMWESGSIYNEGSDFDMATRIRMTEFVDDNKTMVSAASGYSILAVVSDGATHNGAKHWDAVNNKINNGTKYTATIDLTKIRDAGYRYIRIVARRDDGATIGASEGANITFS